MRGRRLLLGGAVTVCGVLGPAGCGDDAGTTDDQATTNDRPSLSTGTAMPPNGSVPGPGTAARGRSDTTPVAAAVAALQTAADAVPEGDPFDLETESTGSDMVFDTKVASRGAEFEVLVDATGRHMLSQQQAHKPSDDIAKLDAGSVTATRALHVVDSRVTDARFDEMEIDTAADGAIIWQIELVRGDNSTATYTVDAQNGHPSGPGIR